MCIKLCANFFFTMINTGLYLDTRRAKKDGTFPLKLRVTYQRKRKYYNLPYSFTPQDFQKITGEKPRGQWKDLKLELSLIEGKAKEIIKSLPVFSFSDFEVRFLNKGGRTLTAYFDRKIKELEQSGRVETALSYRSARGSLVNFLHKETIRFDDITPERLRKYEAWMLSRGNSPTTVGIYLRNVRHLFNEAIRQGEKIRYPFGRGLLYKIPAPRSIKKALSLSDIVKIFKYKPETSSEYYCRDLWAFSYLCAGINVKDIALLKYENISGEFLHFRRAKTAATNVTGRPVSVYLSDEARAIIDRWGNKPEYQGSFIFPILQGNPSAREIQMQVRQAVKMINETMKQVAQKAGITEPVTTYTARHSFATVLKRSGASVEFISEMLGHTSIKTTAAYLDSFEDEAKKELLKKLTQF